MNMPDRQGGDKGRSDWLVGGGEMGKLLRSRDWSKTPLGGISEWPQSLRTTVSLCLASNFPISLAWGPGHTQLYNDGYWPLCGAKHPVAFGQDYSECWASAWPVLGEAFERAWRGESQFLKDQWMYLDRHGYLEETCFTFSFSPIRDESGGVGGLFHPVTEVTEKMVSERRIRALREIMSGAASAQSVEDSLVSCARAMAGFDLDLPFAMLYMVNATGSEARLIAATGALPEAIAPAVLRLSNDGREAGRSTWPLSELISTNRCVTVEDLEGRFGRFACGPHPETPKIAVLLPITLTGGARPTAILIAGASPRLPFDEAYRTFYDLLAGTVASAVASACAYEEERKRAEALAEMDRTKTAFFSNVSHEFRTPLTLILGPLEDELAEHTDPLTGERRERLQTAHRNSLRLLKLVNTLLDFSRIEAGRIDAQYEAVDLAAYTADLASNFRSAIERGGLSLIVDCPPLPDPVYVDREMWEKIVLNLLSNAFKHTFEGGIRVTLRWLGETVELAVEDSGIGIAAGDLPRLFERFHRVANARSRTHEGTGIGLALVYELVRNHGGMMRVESEEGRGSTFFAPVKTGRDHLTEESIATLPGAAGIKIRADAYSEEALRWIADKPNVSERAAGNPSEERDSRGSTARGTAQCQKVAGKDAIEKTSVAKPRILWADDNADMRRYVLRLLSERYEVEAVPDGATAVESALANPPDLILTDVMMPGLDGFGVLRRLRGHDRTKLIPIILLSARAGEEASVEGIDAGADDYLMKPFSARELMARIGTHLRSSRMRKEWAAAIEVRELNLAKVASELKRSNHDLQEFAYAASHDLQEPLRMVTSYVQLLARRYGGKLDADADEFIHFAVDGCSRMKGMIQDLLGYSRAGQNRSPRREVSVEKALMMAVANLRSAIEESGATVTHDALPVVLSDSTQFVLVLQNLIGNAIKYRGPEPPCIHVAATRSDPREWVFSVRDNGLGIEPQYFEKIFVLFQRLHGPGEFSGTGIGLATCKKFVELQGGRIWVDSKVNEGSTFFFSLPDLEMQS